MQYAVDENGQRIRATPKARAFCPVCHESVLAKTGNINIWHWAHVGREDCDPWHEHETVWHRQWKEIVPESWREVVIEHDGKRHRADIRKPNGSVIELQHSSISVDDIAVRERFYGDVTWIFDVASAHGRFDIRPKGNYHTFRWRQARRSIAHAKGQVLLDFGDNYLLEVKKTFEGPPFAGWGYMHHKIDVIAAIIAS